MSRIFLLVGLGGFIGSIARYAVQFVSSKLFIGAFPIGTLTVNLLGSFLIGFLFALSEKSNWMSPEWKFFLMTGLCGGFTTFSAFSLENINLLREGQYSYAFLYIITSLSLCIGATFLGISLYKQSAEF